MTQHAIKTRFCPSPTGLVHLGNIRTALFSALLAAARHGAFLLRIEDTDVERSKVAYVDALMADLKWLGLHWQEGPEQGGDAGPYQQSERQSIYDQYYQLLLEKQQAYPCFCSDEQLLMARKIQLSRGQPPRYAGTCTHLAADEVKAKQDAGQGYTLRFRMPRGEQLCFTDMVKGEQAFASDDIGDFIIRRANGSAPFMYSNAIDDALMGVTDVLRGEDHLSNTPRQIALLQALALPVPVYGHLSLIMGADGTPLSKRNGSQSVQAMREQGYLPMALVNYLSRLGHHYVVDGWLSWSQLCADFSVSALGSSAASFDPAQLLHWQKEAVQRLSAEAFWAWCVPVLGDQVSADRRDAFIDLVKANVVFPKDAAHWASRLCQSWRLTAEQFAGHDLLSSAYAKAAYSAVQQHGDDLKAVIADIKQALGVKGKALFMPLRLLLTGQTDGPEMAKIMTFLGQDELLARLELASLGV